MGQRYWWGQNMLRSFRAPCVNPWPCNIPIAWKANWNTFNSSFFAMTFFRKTDITVSAHQKIMNIGRSISISFEMFQNNKLILKQMPNFEKDIVNFLNPFPESKKYLVRSWQLSQGFHKHYLRINFFQMDCRIPANTPIHDLNLR
jgi:hypothetical protein